MANKFSLLFSLGFILSNVIRIFGQVEDPNAAEVLRSYKESLSWMQSVSMKVDVKITRKEGHKDNIVAEEVATELIKKFDFNKNVVVIAGLHIDNATKEDINRLVKNSNNLVSKLIQSEFFKAFLAENT